MNLAYNILWFEDSEEWIDSMKEKIEDFFEQFGFILNLDIQNDANNLNDLIIKINTYEKDVDIILMDYNLLNDDKGSELIKKIRSNDIFTEIIFYSERTQIKKKFKSECIEGIYFSERDTLFIRLQQIIPHTIKKVIDLTNMRGIVMSETSLLDLDLNNLILSLLNYIDIKDNCKRQVLIDKVFQKRLEQAHKIKEIEHEKRRIKGKEVLSFIVNTTEREKYISDISQLLENIEASDRYQFINKLLKEEVCKKLNINDKHSIFKNYNAEIITKRNILAHVKEDTIEGKKVLKSNFKGYEAFSFSHNDFQLIRKDLIKHKENILLMIQLINNKI